MANIYITEYAELARDTFSFHIAAGKEPALAEQKITNPAASTQSSALDARTSFVMVHVDAAAHIAFGTNPTAATTGHHLSAGETRFYGVPVNNSYKIAAING